MKSFGDTEVTLVENAFCENETGARVCIEIDEIEVCLRSDASLNIEDQGMDAAVEKAKARGEISDERYAIKWDEAERFVDLIAGEPDPVMTWQTFDDK